MSGIRTWLLVAMLIVSCGCATSTSVVGQSLDDGAANLSGIKQTLVGVLLAIEGPAGGSYYRVDDLWATNQTTGEQWRFPLFSNFIMGTKQAPHRIEGARLEQLVWLDLPAGRYVIDQIDLVTLDDFFDATVDTEYFHRPFPKPALTVAPGGAQYFGTLELRLLGIERIGSEYRANVRIVPRGVSGKNMERLKADYPALSGVELQHARVEL